MTATAHAAHAHRAGQPRLSPDLPAARPLVPVLPPVPPDPRAKDPQWPARWPLRGYLELGAIGTAPGTARTELDVLLREWGLTALTEDGQLIISEMVTNAVQATQQEQLDQPVRIWLLGKPGYGLMILIWDAATSPPQPRSPGTEDEHGRGLTIVDALSRQWGTYRPTAHRPSALAGKVVWALLQVPDRTQYRVNQEIQRRETLQWMLAR